MDKTKIQQFSDSVREKLLSDIKNRAAFFGILSDDTIYPVDKEFDNSIIINGKPFDAKIKKQRDILIQEINERGYNQVIDEVTYTWFNRFVALKFMETNEYLPTGGLNGLRLGTIQGAQEQQG